MVFPNYIDADAFLGYTKTCLESNRTQALMGNLVKTGLVVSQRGAGANMSVDVAAGTYSANSVEIASAAVTNVVIAAADVTNPRYDVIYGNSAGTISVTKGTAASSPKVPDLAANAIALAIVAVAANAASIVNANILDLRIIAPSMFNSAGMALHRVTSNTSITGYGIFVGATMSALARKYISTASATASITVAIDGVSTNSTDTDSDSDGPALYTGEDCVALANAFVGGPLVFTSSLAITFANTTSGTHTHVKTVGYYYQ